MSAAASCVLRIELFFFHFLFQRGEEARRATCSGKYAVTSLTWLLGRTPGDRRAWCPLVPWAPAHRPSTVARQGAQGGTPPHACSVLLQSPSTGRSRVAREASTNSADRSRVFRIPIMSNRCFSYYDLHCIQPIKRIP